MDMVQISSAFGLFKIALDLTKDLVGIFPSGPKKEAAAKALEAAETSFRIAQAQAAKGLEYFLCKCTWPPQIMLFQGGKSTLHKCPLCGHEINDASGIAAVKPNHRSKFDGF